jgi:hypothetical protein
MSHLRILGTALMIGYNAEGRCVYSSSMSIHEYWDGEHVWDEEEGVRALGLAGIRGYLFGEDGELLQEFETKFNANTGSYISGWVRHSDGSLQHHVA